MLTLRVWTLLLVAALLVGCETSPSKKTDDDVSVAELVSAVRQACNEAKADIAQIKGLPLTAVSITVQTKVTESIATGFDFVVVSAKGQFDQSATQTLTLKLVPNPAVKALVAQQEIYKELLNVIKAAAVAATAARQAAGSEFGLKIITASIGFDVTKTASGGMKLVVGTVTIGPTVSSGVTGSQKIDLTFGSDK